MGAGPNRPTPPSAVGGPLPGEARAGRPQEALPDCLASPTDLSADLCPTRPSSPTQTRDAPLCLQRPLAGTRTLPPFAPAALSSACLLGLLPVHGAGLAAGAFAPRLVPAPRLQLSPLLCYLHPQTAPQSWGLPLGSPTQASRGQSGPWSEALEPACRPVRWLKSLIAGDEGVTSLACCRCAGYRPAPAAAIRGGTPATWSPVPGAVGTIVSQAGGI